MEQLRHLGELGSIPGSVDNVQPDTEEVTLDCFYVSFSSPLCCARSKHQAHISRMFHSSPYTLSLSSWLLGLGFSTIQAIIILFSTWRFLTHREFVVQAEQAHVCLWNPAQTMSTLCSNPIWNNRIIIALNTEVLRINCQLRMRHSA